MRLQHVSIAIPPDGAEQARAFYAAVLGLEERDVLPKLDPSLFIWFRVGGDCELHLMLLDEPPPESAHFCLASTAISTRCARSSRPQVWRRATAPS